MQLGVVPHVHSVCAKASALIMTEQNHTQLIANVVQEPFYDIYIPMSMIAPACVLIALFFMTLVNLTLVNLTK